MWVFLDPDGVRAGDGAVNQNAVGEGLEEEPEMKKPDMGGGEKKERSVLQAKLTKLAIQIGYAGKIPQNAFFILLPSIIWVIIILWL